MSDINIQNKLVEFTKRRDEALSSETPNAAELKALVTELLAFPPPVKPSFMSFARELKEACFKRGLTFKSFDISLFNSQQTTQQLSEVSDNEINAVLEVQQDFQELLLKVYQSLSDIIGSIKGYFLMRLENNPVKAYQLLILYDTNYFFKQIKKKVETEIPGTNFKSIENYYEELSKGNYEFDNVLCLLLILPKSNDKGGLETLMSQIESIVNSFNSFDSISIRNVRPGDNNYFAFSNNKEQFLDDLNSVTSMLLSNSTLKNEEEKIIKKLFADFDSPLLYYKIISKGNSGATVVEITPKRKLGDQFEKRFIVKYSAKDEDRKIRTEYRNFRNSICGYKGFDAYDCEYKDTMTHEGIRYSYAISDHASNSYPFSEILENQSNQYHSTKVEIISNLFEIDIFKAWKESQEVEKSQVRDIYGKYINVEAIKEQISKILDIRGEALEALELIQFFNRIWNFEGDFQMKICHGDLHTDNFFTDSKIYLIDFGYTDVCHALADHTSLECSLKFRHFPRYISIEEQRLIESELLKEDSFMLSYEFESTRRANLLTILNLIKRIRYHASTVKSNHSNMREYYISLFLMTFRQIRYADMNQIYAYESALLISRKLNILI